MVKKKTLTFLIIIILATIFISTKRIDVYGGNCSVKYFRISNKNVTKGDHVTLEGEGSCSGGVRAVKFIIDGEDKAEIGAPKQTETFKSEEYSVGSHNVCFVVTDGDWNVGTKSCDTIYVNGTSSTSSNTASNSSSSNCTVSLSISNDNPSLGENVTLKAEGSCSGGARATKFLVAGQSKAETMGGTAIEIFKSNEYGAGNVSVCAVTAKASDWSDQAKQCSTITINGSPSNKNSEPANSEPANSEPTNPEPEYASGSNSSPKKSSSGYDITQFHFPGWPESNYMKQIYVPKGSDGIVFWSSPGGENNVAYGYVVEDTRYELIEQKNGWSHILFPGSPKMDGWVKNSDIVIKQETVCRADAVPVDLTGDWVEVVKNVLSAPFHQIPSALSHEINYILVIPENIPSEYQIYYKNQIMPNKDNRILHQSYEVYKIAPNTQSLGIDTTWAMRNAEWKEIPNWYITFNCYK